MCTFRWIIVIFELKLKDALKDAMFSVSCVSLRYVVLLLREYLFVVL